jgi:diguanylate cyclase (GGDEF)-like protein
MAWVKTLWAVLHELPATSHGQDLHSVEILLSLLRGSIYWLCLQLLFVTPIFAVRKVESSVLILLGIVMALASLFLLRRGQFRQAAFCFLSAVWLGTLICSLLSGGIRSVYMILHVWIPIVTALLLGTRAGISAICASASTTFVLALLDGAGFQFPRYFPTAGLNAWMVLMLSLITTALPINQTLNALTQALASARKQTELYSHAALHDPLTKLPNRSFFLNRLTHCLQRGQGSRGHGYSLLFIDIDDFKTINDGLGHSAGDQVLKVTATRMSTLMRPVDILARFGGDEFTVLIEDTTDPAEAIHLADLLLNAINLPIPLASKEVKLTASIGIAHGKPAYLHPDSILTDADSAMYYAKTLGKNRHATFLEVNTRSASGGLGSA